MRFRPVYLEVFPNGCNHLTDQVVFATLSKGLGARTSVYGGAAWFTDRDGLRALGGLQVDVSRRVTLVLQHDGLNLHPAVRLQLGRHAISLLAVEAEQPGVAWLVRF